MPTSVLDRITEKLHTHPEEVENALYELTSQIRERVESASYAVVPDLGTFRIFKGNLVFEPVETLAVAVNFRFAGLEPVTINASPTRQSYRRRDVMTIKPVQSNAAEETNAAPSFAISPEQEPPFLPGEEDLIITPIEEGDANLSASSPSVEEESVFVAADDVEGQPDSEQINEFDKPQESIQAPENEDSSADPEVIRSIQRTPAFPDTEYVEETRQQHPKEDIREIEEESLNEVEPEVAVFSEDAKSEATLEVEEIISTSDSYDTESVRAVSSDENQTESYPEKKRSPVPVLLAIASVLIITAILLLVFMPFDTGDDFTSAVSTEASQAELNDLTSTQDPAVPPVNPEAAESISSGDAETGQPTPSEPVEEVPEEPAILSSLGETESINIATGGYTIVVASRSESEPALAYSQRFRDRSIRSSVLHGPHLGVIRYRVAVGQFPTESDAQNALQDESLEIPEDAWIMRIQSDLEVVE